MFLVALLVVLKEMALALLHRVAREPRHGVVNVVRAALCQWVGLSILVGELVQLLLVLSEPLVEGSELLDDQGELL